MTRAHRALAALSALVALVAVLAVTTHHAAPARPAASPLAASSGVDDAHELRIAELRANRAEHRHTLAVAAARARAAAARARAAAARAARFVATSVAGVTAVWIALVQCEAGGRWRYGAPDVGTDPGYDFEGGPNFAHSTWLSFRLPGYPLHAYDATPLQQVTVARRVLRAQGVRAWPVCGPRVGLRPGD